MHLLVGTDGAQKMSKSLGNTIDLEDPTHEQYGKVMSIPDSALLDYLELTTDIPDEELAYIRKQLEERAVNPMVAKKRLARDIVSQFHGESSAQEAEAEFERTYERHEAPTEATDVRIARSADGRDAQLVVDLLTLLPENRLVPSKAEARRLIRQGGVEIDGVKVAAESAHHVVVQDGTMIRIGKHRFLRIVDANTRETL
jgi:tyrosyl-tRNA synthetase